MAFAIPPRVDDLNRRQLLEEAVKATEEAAKEGQGFDNKAALWIFALLCLSERSGKMMLCYTLAIAALTFIVTVATIYQAVCK